MNWNGQDYQPPQVLRESLSTYVSKTFGWMFLGLLTTFALAFAGYQTGLIYFVFINPYVFYALAAGELVLVLFLSARITKLRVNTARALFFAYAVLNAVTFSALFILYQVTSLVLVFGMVSLYFGAMALYGYFTKADLSRLRPVLTFGAIFLCLFWVLSLFLNLSAMETGICLIGIVIFLGFTAYDTQKIKSYYTVFSADQEMLQKASIFSALQLYLDFINLFLYVIRLLGKRR